MQNNVEILSPAGSIDSFIAAINAGADAVYMGVDRYNARTMSKNFTVEEYLDAIFEAHKRGVKVYLTLNTLVKDDEIKDALNIVAKLYSHGLDAVILQDLGLAQKLHELFPKLAMHASTQMSVYSKEQVQVLKRLGFSRVVLARGLTIEEIKEICESTDLEIEVFVHGALCVCVSGQCNISRLIGSRSANRGNCAQPCRRKYSLYKTGESKSIISGKYILSKKDIFGIELVNELIDAGVTSLKIEGRNKTPEYVALTTKMYKKALTDTISDRDIHDLLQMFNRSGKSEGYLNGVQYKDSISTKTPKNIGLKLGKVLDVKNKFVKVKLEENINLHDGIEIYSDENVLSTIVTCIKDEKFNIVNSEMKNGEYVWLGDINSKCKVGSVIYKTTDSVLSKNIIEEYTRRINRKILCDVKVTIKSNENVQVEAKLCDKIIKHVSDIVPEKSINHSLTKEKVESVFSTFSNVNVVLEENIYISKANLNKIRRDVLGQVEKEYFIDIDVSSEYNEIEYIEKPVFQNTKLAKRDFLYIYKYDTKKDYIKEYKNKYGTNMARLYISAQDYLLYEQDILSKYLGKTELFFAIPNVTLKKLNRYITKNLERLINSGVKGVLLGSLQYIDFLSEIKNKYDIKVVADYSLNISNTYTMVCLRKLSIDEFTMSFELTDEDIASMLPNKNIELVENLACAMTSRYCILGSFVSDRKSIKDVCSRPCVDSYYIVDELGKQYDIVCDNIDCIMRLIRNKNRYKEEIEKKVNIRHTWL